MTIGHRALIGAAAALTVLVPSRVAYAATDTSSNQSGIGLSAASSNSNWQKVQTKLISDLQHRVQTLSKLTTSVNGSKTLSSQDKSTLSSRLSNETSGIAQLLSEVQTATPQDTTVTQLRADSKTMVDDYRVYLVMSPQVHLSEWAGTQTSNEIKLENNESKLQATIQKAGNPSDAVHAYDDLVTQATNAARATGSANLPSVLGMTPQGYPGNKAPIGTARSALRQAATDLKAARGDRVTIENILKQHDAQILPSAS